MFEHEDLAELVRALISTNADLMADQVDVRLGYLYGDYWPPDWTWVRFVLEEGAEALVDGVAAAIVTWGGQWLWKRRRTDPETPPIKAQIFGPDGKVMREVEVPSPKDPGS